MMLKLTPKERPSADQLLRSNDLFAKLQLDEAKPAAAGVQFDHDMQRQALLQTILVPQNLRHLNSILPKPCYPAAAAPVAAAAVPAAAVPEVNTAHSIPDVAPPVPPTIPSGLKKDPSSRAPLGVVHENVPKDAVHHGVIKGEYGCGYTPAPPKACPPAAVNPANGNGIPSVAYSARPGRINAPYAGAPGKPTAAPAAAPAAPSVYNPYAGNGMAPPPLPSAAAAAVAGIPARVVSHRVW